MIGRPTVIVSVLIDIVSKVARQNDDLRYDEHGHREDTDEVEGDADVNPDGREGMGADQRALGFYLVWHCVERIGVRVARGEEELGEKVVSR